ncbi:phage major capsid protein [Streptococcus agalactiae]|uniref:phage major capsid protein n=1 Tax=Streptococcus agalactiae TaxID=1311 RepID=UPI0002DBD6A1|nr:phage major capsid protein [Streptococcus agalactiae]QBX29941.1 major capsid protein [Streptococcus phage Javan52]EPX14602.1 phage capsid protein [Streptococcus agalactiae str. Gottschalk 1002A]EPX26148.1 phage capsid protein [Streptococcus agalactiae str. Gottschalk 19247]MBY4835808.1 phage major capsid protein [Streptococcus agalactiae]MBY5053934.1 phage major capsid protein [Streptococcus agalactiae]
MTMKLSNEFNEIRQKFVDAVSNQAPQEEQSALYNNMLEAMFEESKKVAQAEVESAIALTPDDAKMTARERKFFNEIVKTAPAGLTELIPEETVDRIFEDLTTKHPLIGAIGLKNMGLRMKFIDSDSKGKAEWGDLYGEIKGQLQASFSSTKAIQHKLTAYVVIPKDAVKFGPGWLLRFIMTQIDEAFAVALEEAFLNGDGNGKPIGLSRTLKGKVVGEKATYDAKKPTGVLTFKDPSTTVKELTMVHKYHSVKEDGKTVVEVDGNIVIVVNPADAWDVKKQYTSLNANGTFVTALPYNVTLIESVHQKAKEVTTFVKGRYDAYVAGGIELHKYTETYALEDLDLFTAKQFAYGRAKDETSAAVWTLSVADPIVISGEPGVGAIPGV